MKQLKARLSFIWLQAKGAIAYAIVKPLPVPFDAPGTLRYRLSARLWGIAYWAGSFASFEDYRDYRSSRLKAQEKQG